MNEEHRITQEAMQALMATPDLAASTFVKAMNGMDADRKRAFMRQIIEEAHRAGEVSTWADMREICQNRIDGL